MTTDRAVTMAQPPLKPWTNRRSIISPMDGAKAHATEAAVITTSETSNGVRRPRASLTGPPTS